MLVRLRLVHRDVRPLDGLLHRGILQARPVCEASDRPRLALHRVYELVGQAGAEGRRRNRRDLGRSVRVGRQERAVQGHPCPFAR